MADIIKITPDLLVLHPKKSVISSTRRLSFIQENWMGGKSVVENGG